MNIKFKYRYRNYYSVRKIPQWIIWKINFSKHIEILLNYKYDFGKLMKSWRKKNIQIYSVFCYFYIIILWISLEPKKDSFGCICANFIQKILILFKQWK